MTNTSFATRNHEALRLRWAARREIAERYPFATFVTGRGWEGEGAADAAREEMQANERYPVEY